MHELGHDEARMILWKYIHSPQCRIAGTSLQCTSDALLDCLYRLSIYISLPPSLLSSLTEVYTLMSTRWLRVITRVHVYIQYIQQKALHWKACTNHGGSLTLGIYKYGLLTSRLLKCIHNRHPGIMSYTKQKHKRGINAYHNLQSGNETNNIFVPIIIWGVPAVNKNRQFTITLVLGTLASFSGPTQFSVTVQKVGEGLISFSLTQSGNNINSNWYHTMDHSN